MHSFVNFNKIIKYLIIAIIFQLIYISVGHAEVSRNTIIIAIDIGHTKNNYGALSAHGVKEYYFNRAVALLLLSELKKAGYIKTFIINKTGGDISLIDRANQANQRKANLFIAIHHDSVQPIYLSTWIYKGKELYSCDLYKGYSIFISKYNGNVEGSLIFSSLLGRELLKRGFSPTLHHAEHIKGENKKLLDKEKGVYEYDNLVVLKNTKYPAVLLECGVIKNREEEDSINSDYRHRIVSAIVYAVIKFFRD